MNLSEKLSIFLTVFRLSLTVLLGFMIVAAIGVYFETGKIVSIGSILELSAVTAVMWYLKD